VTGGIGFIDGGSTLYKFFNEKNVLDSLGNVVNEHEFWAEDPVSNHQLRALGQIGAGLEFRVTCHIGLMADFTWNFVFGQENHPDKLHLITEQGTSTTTVNDLILGTTTTSTIVTNQALELRPGHSSDN